MVRKYFPHDKNYLLEQAQLRQQEGLLRQLVDRAAAAYEQAHNPLGLRDRFHSRLRNPTADLHRLHAFYCHAAAAYRYRHGSNQLEFLWEGMDHAEKYGHDWRAAFEDLSRKLCREPHFIRLVLELTVFASHEPSLASGRMDQFIQAYFQVRLRKDARGNMRVA